MGILRIAAILFAAMILHANRCDAQVIVLDGLGGAAAKFMRPEAIRLSAQGHQVTYRPWWRWRSAVRTAPNAEWVIGFSMGAPRALRIAQTTNARSLELVDPVSRNRMAVPPGLKTTVYRATRSSRISSSPVYGRYQTRFVPTNHVGMPTNFRN